MFGFKLIKSHLIDAPTLPGIYKMLDDQQQILYIGKAKNLKKRLAHYINVDLDSKTLRMVALTQFIEYIITDSEVAALLLEAQLIKKFQPKFNIVLKDDKSFPYIKLRLDHDYPQLIKYRGKNLTGGEFFGPFASAEQVDTTLAELQKIFKLRSCSDNYFINRRRPCLQYQIGRCYAPCVGQINKEAYHDLVIQIKNFLKGKTKKLQELLSKKMEELSQQLRFEDAAEIRDRIKALSYIQLKSNISSCAVVDADVIAIVEKNCHYCVQVFLYRAGQACGNIAYFPIHTENTTKAKVLAYFISQFYHTQQVPNEIILNHKIDEANLIITAIKQFNHQSKLTIPLRGNKVKLVEHAEINTSLTLEQHLKQFAKSQAIFTELKELFNLAEIPERIEIYDNSHIMGSLAIGAMVVANQTGFDKKEYRIFNISIAQGDDYEMLRQVLTRRFTKLQKELHRFPSLMIIDGGKGHLSVVTEIMTKFNLKLPFVCMSKGANRNAGCEQFHMLGREVFTIDKNHSVMKYLQILRDAAHNFAIKNHRLRRSKAIKASDLDNINSIGKIRKKALLHYFGSYKAICDATIDELSKAQGISPLLAKTIFVSLHGK